MCLIGSAPGLLIVVICCAYANGKIIVATTNPDRKNKDIIIP